MNKLSHSTIYRLLEQSCKETLDFDLLIEFIFKSIDTRFIFLKFVELHRMSETGLERFFQNIEEESNKHNERYFDYIQFDFNFYQRAKTRYEKLLREKEETKQELTRTKETLNTIQTNFEQTKTKLDQTNDELIQTKNELYQVKEELPIVLTKTLSF